MSFQIAGLAIVLFGIGLFLIRSDLLLHAALFFTFFENVAVVVLRRPQGDFGVPAWLFFVGLGLAARLLLKPGPGLSRPRSPGSRPYQAPLLLFVAACLLSLIVTYGIAGRESIPAASLLRRAYPQPIVLDAANFVILIPMLAALLLAVLIVRDADSVDELVSYLRTVAIAVSTVALLGLAEYLCVTVGLPNPLVAVRALEPDRAEVRLGSTSLYRLTSVSFEPSMLSRVLLVGLFLILMTMIFRIRLIGPTADVLGLGVIGLVLVLTSATTAFVGLVVGLVAALLFVIRRSALRTKIMLAACATSTLGMSYLAYQRSSEARQVLDLLVFDKVDSDSYLERTTATDNAFETMARHPLLGVGLGESGSYDLVSKVGSNVGAVGLLAFLLLVAGTLVRLWRQGNRTDGYDQRLCGIDAALGTVILMMLLVFQVTGFFFEAAYFWAILGLAWVSHALVAASRIDPGQLVAPHHGSRRTRKRSTWSGTGTFG